jgi:hypothetical protein
MFENLWYAVEFSAAITDRPQLITIFDRQITISWQAAVKTYPLQEKDCWVWLFLGDRLLA